MTHYPRSLGSGPLGTQGWNSRRFEVRQGKRQPKSGHCTGSQPADGDQDPFLRCLRLGASSKRTPKSTRTFSLAMVRAFLPRAVDL